MVRVQTMVQLSDELVARLDTEAARRGTSRSGLIREILEEALAQDREAWIGRRIVEGYTRLPPGVPDDWGSLEALSDAATYDALRRLDSEEQRAGLAPW
jgi:predicted transcriptional regulator